MAGVFASDSALEHLAIAMRCEDWKFRATGQRRRLWHASWNDHGWPESTATTALHLVRLSDSTPVGMHNQLKMGLGTAGGRKLAITHNAKANILIVGHYE